MPMVELSTAQIDRLVMLVEGQISALTCVSAQLRAAVLDSHAKGVGSAPDRSDGVAEGVLSPAGRIHDEPWR